MARKIRFPLKMKNGAEVRTLDELKENFDLESVLGYFTDGKLATWLADRYYDEKAEAVSALSTDTPDLNAKLCEILEVEYQGDDDVADLEYIQRRNEKLRILSSFTDNKEILNNIDIIAMSQDELFDILDEKPEKVYLYGEKFEIPFGIKNICYIGVNSPHVVIDKNKYADDFDDAGISFSNCVFDEGAYQKKIVYPDPVGEFEIENGVLKKGIPNSEGVCIIPYGVIAIGRYAFSTNLLSVIIPDTVTHIEESAFSGCSNLTNVTIPNSINKIGAYSFSNCKRLTSVIIPGSVSCIESGAFNNCYKLATVALSEGIKQIENGAFKWCESLKSIIIPNSVEIIDKAAFTGSGLETIIIPGNVKTIEEHTFSSCERLKKVVISYGVNEIKPMAFFKCINLESVDIPDSVTSIGGQGFQYCERLASITIPSSVSYLGNTAFANCKNLTNVTILGNYTGDGHTAFYYTPWGRNHGYKY